MDVPVNPNILKCFKDNSNESVSVDDMIELLNVVNINEFYDTSKIRFKRSGDLFYYVPPIIPQKYIAAFDVDWTLTFSEKKLEPYRAEPWDIKLLPNRKRDLIMLFKKGYTIVLFTNQGVKPEKAKYERVERISTLIRKLGIPCYVFIATGHDEYRKPDIGMWSKFMELIGNHMDYGFFVGDALGRPQDFAATDKEFAMNMGLPYYSPEEFFTPSNVVIREGKTMVVMVGMQGAGKSVYAERELVPKGYVHISSDNFKSNKERMIREVKKVLQAGKNVVIDATNPKQEDRERYYDMAGEFGYNIVVIYFVRNGFGWNELRGENKVPRIAYNLYFKNLDPPSKLNTPGEFYMLD